MIREIVESDRMDKDVKLKLDKVKTIKTKKRTASLWYSPDTEYAVDSVDDGFYSKKPGIRTKDGFIPLKDIVVESFNEASTSETSLLREIVEGKSDIKWNGGADDYTTANKIEAIIKTYDFYTDYIDSYAQKQKADKKNQDRLSQLKKLGVTSITKDGKTKEVK